MSKDTEIILNTGELEQPSLDIKEWDPVIPFYPETPPDDFDDDEDLVDKKTLENEGTFIPVKPDDLGDLSNLKYTAAFRNTSDDIYTVNIYIQDYLGTPTELLLADNPVVIEWRQDDMYQPLKQSVATIRILTDHILTDLYRGDMFGTAVEILKGNNVIWKGYISPNVYNQEYCTDLDTLEIECIDALAALDYKKYTYITGENKVSTIYEIVKHCFEQSTDLDSLLYTNYLDNNNLQLPIQWAIQERNFFDEEGEPQTCKSVLEHINKVLGTTMFIQGQNILMVDREKCNDYKESALGFSQFKFSDPTFYSTFYNLNIAYPLDVADNTCNISYNDVYNQVNVIANLNEYEESFINIESKDNENLEQIKPKIYKYYLSTSDKSSYESMDGNTFRTNTGQTGDYQFNTLVYMFYKRKDCFTSVNSTTSLPEHLMPNNAGISYDMPVGSSWFERYMKRSGCEKFRFIPEDADKPSMTNGFCFRIKDSFPIAGYYENSSGNYGDKMASLLREMGTGTVVFSTSSDNRKYSSDDFLLLDFDLKYSTQPIPEIPVNNDDIQPYQLDLQDNTYYRKNIANYILTTNYSGNYHPSYSHPFALLGELKIGNLYYNGTSWTTTPSKFVIKGQPVNNYSDVNATFKVFNTNTTHTSASLRDNGMLIVPPNIEGELKFSLYNSVCKPLSKSEMTAYKNRYTSSLFRYDESVSQIKTASKGDLDTDIKYVHIKDLSLKYCNSANYGYEILDLDSEEEDIKYSADINKDNIVELDDIVCYVNTKNPSLSNKESYSYLIKDNSYISTVLVKNENIRPEENIVRKYVDFYSKPRLKYSNTTKYVNQEAIDFISIDDKLFTVGNMSINLKYNTLNFDAYDLQD